jgi:membrane protein
MAESQPGDDSHQAGLSRRLARLGDALDRFYVRTNRKLRGYPGLFYRVGLTFTEHDGAFISAALAYYALFSFFPLLLILIVVSSSLLSTVDAKAFALDLVARYLPGVVELASTNIEQILRERNALGVVALLGLVWAASGVFSALYRAVNNAWGDVRPLKFWHDRAFALVSTIVIGLLFLLNMALSTMLSVIQSWRLPVLGWQVFMDPAWSQLSGWLSALVSLAITILLFSTLYRALPRAPVAWRDVWPGGIAAAIAWQIAKQVFTWWLGLARYNLIYGSVGTIAGFLLWAYLSALILLVGAEFTAQYAQWRRAGRPVDDRLPREVRQELL